MLLGKNLEKFWLFGKTMGFFFFFSLHLPLPLHLDSKLTLINEVILPILWWHFFEKWTPLYFLLLIGRWILRWAQSPTFLHPHPGMIPPPGKCGQNLWLASHQQKMKKMMDVPSSIRLYYVTKERDLADIIKVDFKIIRREVIFRWA